MSLKTENWKTLSKGENQKGQGGFSLTLTVNQRD